VIQLTRFDVLIMGASTRAAAFSALRCGLRPRCVDAFADRDLSAVCPVDRVDLGNAPAGFIIAAESIPPSPWFYTGGFENWPDAVDRISRRHRLWGVGGSALRAVRDPLRVATALEQGGIPAPAVRADVRGLPRNGSWLAKPIASGGGLGIEPLRPSTRRRTGSSFLQQRIAGQSFSALFIAGSSQTALIGVTRQRLGAPGASFAYRGSIGPLRVSAAMRTRLVALGDRLTAAFRLSGWFGVDYVEKGGIPWPVEVNPRYTASVEIHELAGGRCLLEEHARACGGLAEPHGALAQRVWNPAPVLAKEILYAPGRLVVPEIPLGADLVVDWFDVPTIADIPWPATRFQRGEPVMTVFAAGPDQATCRARLTRLTRAWKLRLGFITKRYRRT
jgi:predicted ATP-grasp superfamily ATP-dependent carboligase